MNIGFIGAGKMGFSLGKYFRNKDLAVAGYYSLNPESARAAAEFTGTRAFPEPADLLAACDCLLLTVPDDALPSLWQRLERLPLAGKMIGHCSGALSSSVFTGIQTHGACGCSVHPLMAVPDKYTGHLLLEEASFAVEGDGQCLKMMRELIALLGNPVYVLNEQEKVLYHCAAVFASNFAVALARISADMFQACGLEAATPGLFRLMEHNVRSIRNHGIAQALTGPVERGDAATIQRHLACLEGEDRQLYQLLAKRLAGVAQAKHPDRDFSQIYKALGDIAHEEHG